MCSDESATSLPPEVEPAEGYFLSPALRERRAALVVAHPGHELRVHGWMALAHPLVCVLTDGSGHTGQSRLESTTKVLAQSGARPGAIYGRFKDVEIYAAILDNNAGVFIGLAEELSEALVRDSVEYVVGDASEGYNPIHDLCRSVINTAVELANGSNSSRIANLDFLVVGLPGSRSHELRTREIRLRLDEGALARKLAAAESYLELAGQVSRMTSESGSAAFDLEALRPVVGTGAYGPVQEPPFYELYGEKQVAEGYYRRVIRYREHILPLAEAVETYAQR